MLHEASPEEIGEVQLWIEQSEANKKYFDDFKYIWKKSEQLSSIQPVNENEAWFRFQQKLANQDCSVQMRKRQFSFGKIAAILLLLMGIGTAIFFITYNRFEKVEIYSNSNVVNDTLPDGSIIVLNKHSSISYKKSFSKTNREISLQGEAFFNVKPDKKNPFQIATGNNVQIDVVGTSFNVNEQTDFTQIVVKTGIVTVQKGNEKIFLYPNEKITIQADQSQLKKEKNTDDLYAYYRTKLFNCYNTPLSDLVSKLNEAYHSNIILDNVNIGKLQLTTTFKNESLDDILDVIATTFNLKIEKSKDHILIKQ